LHSKRLHRSNDTNGRTPEALPAVALSAKSLRDSQEAGRPQAMLVLIHRGRWRARHPLKGRTWDHFHESRELS